jgi:hypothetical protein
MIVNEGCLSGEQANVSFNVTARVLVLCARCGAYCNSEAMSVSFDGSTAGKMICSRCAAHPNMIS